MEYVDRYAMISPEYSGAYSAKSVSPRDNVTASPSPHIGTCEGNKCPNDTCFPTFPENKFLNNPYTWVFLIVTLIILIIMLCIINSTSGQKTPWYNSMKHPWPFSVTWALSFLIVVMMILFWLACSFGSVSYLRLNCINWGFYLIMIILLFWCLSFFWKHMFDLSLGFLLLGLLILFWLGWVIGVSDGFRITGLVLVSVFALFMVFLVCYTGGHLYMNPGHNGIP